MSEENDLNRDTCLFCGKENDFMMAMERVCVPCSDRIQAHGYKLVRLGNEVEDEDEEENVMDYFDAIAQERKEYPHTHLSVIPIETVKPDDIIVLRMREQSIKEMPKAAIQQIFNNLKNRFPDNPCLIMDAELHIYRSTEDA